ncbi:hypothetical protein FRC12_000079 [Ceratobasidium sp. 428]|nr:hypothetical protein FRC12_000079 [Ceratobasidium sp. 428]
MSNRHRPRQGTTLFVDPTSSQPAGASQPTTTLSLGSAVNTATEVASNSLPTQLVFDSSAVSAPVGAATDGNAATMSVSPIFVGTDVDPKLSVAPATSTPAPPTAPSSTPSSSSSSPKNDLPVAAIIMAIVAAAAIGALFLFLWYRKRARRRGHSHSRVDSGPPAGDVLRKLGTTNAVGGGAYSTDKSDPFSDAHASVVDPFADPEKAEPSNPYHNRSGSDSFLSMTGPRQPYTHSASASTGSTASSKIRRKEAEQARTKDLVALNNLVRALDHKDRKAEQEGRERRSLPPVELFKAALVR